MRRAADGYHPLDDSKLEAMIKEMNKATKKAEKAIDTTLAFVAASNKRIAKMVMEAKRKTP